MKKYLQALIGFALVAFLIVIITPLAFSQQETTFKSNAKETSEILISQASSESDGESVPENQKQQATPKNNKEAPVVLDGETLFTIKVGGRTTTAEQRAELVSEEILEIANNFSISIDSLALKDFEEVILITAEEDIIMVAVTNDDAEAANRPLEELAEEYLQTIKDSISQFREKRSSKHQAFGLIYLLISTVIFVILLSLINKIFPIIYRRIDTWQNTLFRALRIQNFQILSAEQEANTFLALIKLIHWALVLGILYIYIPLVLSFFYQTERFGKIVFKSLYAALGNVWNAFITFLPNLFFIVLTIVVAYYIIRFCRLIFNALGSEDLSLPGFYPEWAEPTRKLAVILIIAVAAVLIFPYLPGFNSASFRGLSLLFGALITIGGASAVANLIGGYVIIYTRGFQIGDRVKVGDFVGVVLEKTVLSTRIHTPNNEIITIPNSTMIASSVINYTATIRDVKEPLILHTTITLGYDVPWRKVHQVLIEAALATSDILEEPAPFVLQTSLDDFYVSYELKAYTNQPSRMPKIYSQLHQNIQDKCNEAEIEIMSPHYSAVRDGHLNTIPENYLPNGYTPPGFRFHPLDQLFNRPQNPSSQQAPSED